MGVMTTMSLMAAAGVLADRVRAQNLGKLDKTLQRDPLRRAQMFRTNRPDWVAQTSWSRKGRGLMLHWAVCGGLDFGGVGQMGRWAVQALRCARPKGCAIRQLKDESTAPVRPAVGV